MASQTFTKSTGPRSPPKRARPVAPHPRSRRASKAAARLHPDRHERGVRHPGVETLRAGRLPPSEDLPALAQADVAKQIGKCRSPQKPPAPLLILVRK